MSFGFGVGDFIAVGGLCWKVYKRCKDSPGNFAQLSSEVGSLHNVLKETEEVSSKQELTPKQRLKLTQSRQGCEEVLKDLDERLTKYESMGTKARRAIDRVGFGMHDMTAIRLRLISNITMLNAFNDASSIARLEYRMKLLIAEVRSGRREGSVISTQTFDTATRNDQQTWEALRKELEDIGISSSIITERRQFIIEWFQKAVAAGELEEDAPPDDSDSATSLHESHDSGIEVDSDLTPIKGMPSSMVEPLATAEAAIRDSPPVGQRFSGRPIALSPARSPRENTNPRDSEQLLLAAEKGDVSEIEDLLRKGVNIHVQDEWDQTALHIAAGKGREEAVRLLLFRGADVHAKDHSGYTALYHAAATNEQCVRLLLGCGADFQAKDSSGFTALMPAVIRGCTSTVQLMLENGADLEAQDVYGWTALTWAVILGHTSTVQVMLEKGADLEAKDSDGETALMRAACYGHTSIVQVMLEKGADLEAKNSDGETALMRAAWYGHTSTVQVMLEKGADLEAKDSYDETALMRAVEYDHISIVQVMLEKGADLEAKDLWGDTALSLAKQGQNRERVKLIREMVKLIREMVKLIRKMSKARALKGK